MWAACCVFLCSYIVFLLLALVMISSSLNTNIQFSMQITRKITSVSSRVDKRPSTIQSQTFLHLSVFFTCQTLHCLSVCVCVCVCVWVGGFAHICGCLSCLFTSLIVYICLEMKIPPVWWTHFQLNIKTNGVTSTCNPSWQKILSTEHNPLM